MQGGFVAQNHPACIDGFELSINALKQMFRLLREQYGFKFLLSNRLNQDALENHFAVIPSRGGFHDNPDPNAFEATFRQVLVQHLLMVPKESNCSDDMLNMQDVGSCSRSQTVFADVLRTLNTRALCTEDFEDSRRLSTDSLDQLCNSNVCELNAVIYVGGYVVKVILSGHSE